MVVKQYEDAAIPGVPGAVIHVSDIEQGRHAEVWIKYEDKQIAKGELVPGDDLPFVIGDKLRVAHVASYDDEIIEDEARFRIEGRPPKNVIRASSVPQPVKELPGTLTVGEIGSNKATLRFEFPDGPWSPSLFVGEVATQERGEDRYRITLLAVGKQEAFVQVRRVRR